MAGELESFGMSKPQGAWWRKCRRKPSASGGYERRCRLELQRSFGWAPSDLPPIGSSPAGEPAQVEVMRATPSGAQRITLSVVTGELPEEAQASGAEPSRPPVDPGIARALGAEVADLTAEQRRELNVEGGGGVIVREVNDGPMAAAGVKTGDVISVSTICR